MIKAFIDGREGTSGLQLESRLRALPGVTLLDIDPALRKDAPARKKLLNQADAVFLCLPDAAAREAVSMIENPDVVVIDASTAHRTAPGWDYGFPELSAGHEDAVRRSFRIANPGCHATGFCALVYPLIQSGLLSPAQALSCFSLTGYSGGGKSLISAYETGAKPAVVQPYALGLTHKHLPEMTAVCGLVQPPVFMPVVANVYAGMLVSVPLFMNAETARACLAEHYKGKPFVKADSCPEEKPDMEGRNGTNILDIFVYGHEEQTLLMARFDNLGKGASGAAVQNFCLRFGIGED